MSWHEDTAGRYTRQLDATEANLAFQSGSSPALDREHLAVSAYAKIRLNEAFYDMRTALREAWKALRFDCPSIAATLHEETTLVYNVPKDDASIEKWLDDTVLVEEDIPDARTLVATIKPRPLPSIHYLPKSSELLVHASHWRIDGIGSLVLLNNFLSILANPRDVTFGSEPKSLSPSVEEALNCPNDPPEEIKHLAKDLAREFRGHLPSVAVPPRPDALGLPQATRYEVFSFHASATTAAILACKTRNITISSAVYAAVALTTYEMATPETKKNSYVTMRPLNLRPYLSAPFSGTHHACSVYVTAKSTIIRPDMTWNEAVEACGKRNKWPPVPGMERGLRQMVNTFLQLIVEDPLPLGAVFETGFVGNSIGVMKRYIDRRHGGEKGESKRSIEVLEPHLTGEMHTPMISMYIWTWRGKLLFSANYNETFFQAEYVRKLVLRTNEILSKGLGVDMKGEWKED